jgi:3-oxoacyl-[acyl-carrier-protein] synthase III
VSDVFLTAAGAFLPGPPVANDEIAAHLGLIDGKSERLGRLTLRQNRIRRRHYAIGLGGAFLHTNAEMAARAVRNALEKSELTPGDIDFLAAATTQGDLLVPGHGSAVHAELGGGPLEIASFQSVCASSMMAAKAAVLQVRADGKRAGVAVGSEFSSRFFRPGFYQDAEDALGRDDQRLAAEFLRWTLSDGAGAVLFEPRPNERRQSFKVEWVRLVSLASHFETCMFAGTAAGRRGNPDGLWSHHVSPIDAVRQGAVMLLQDMALLKRIIRAWVGEYLKLVDIGMIDPPAVDWLLCHYSAHSLREEIVSIMKATGGMIDEEKWFTNLPEKGNTGSAALFIMLDEFIGKGMAQPGQSILCIVPESGRAVVSFMMLTAQ